MEEGDALYGAKQSPSWRDWGLRDCSQLWVLPVLDIFLLSLTFALGGVQQNVKTINHILEKNENRQWRTGNRELEEKRGKVQIDL